MKISTIVLSALVLLGSEVSAGDEPARPALVGFWESVDRSMGGIGSAMEFRSDGAFRVGLVVQVDAKYEVKDDRLTRSWTDSKATSAPLGRFEGDVWTQEGIRKKRVGVGPAGAPAVVGTWTYAHYTGVPAWERYGADGTMSLRVPMGGTAMEGRYEVDGGTLRETIAGRKAELGFRIQGELLTVTEAPGKTSEYRRAGEKAWYGWMFLEDPERAPAGPTRSLPGLWESLGRGPEGIGGSAIELRADGTCRSGAFLRLEDWRYEVASDRLTLFRGDGPRPASEPLGRFEGDVWIRERTGKAFRMKRVAAGPAGAPPIVGTWTWTDDDTPALTQWERYGTDGTMSRRIPGAAASGRYEADAGTLRRVSDTGERTEEPFRIQGDLLSLTDSWGTTRRFAWAGEKAWYEWFTMPVVPPQPR